MVKHIILWQLKDELEGERKDEVKKGIKEGLEGLQGVIPGLLDIKALYSRQLPSVDGSLRPHLLN